MTALRWWFVSCALACLFAVAVSARPKRASVRPLPPRPAPIARSHEWPIYDTACRGDEACLLDRYREARALREAAEVGGLEMALGEAFAGSGPLLAAITPPAHVAPSEAACNRLSNRPVIVPTEALRRPQRDCYFGCLEGDDVVDCVRRGHCAKQPVLDGEWTLVTIVPRNGCLALLPKADPRCADVPEMTEVAAGARACSPQRLCAYGADEVPAAMAPFVQAPGEDCELRPRSWTCQQVIRTFPRARCQYGS